MKETKTCLSLSLSLFLFPSLCERGCGGTEESRQMQLQVGHMKTPGKYLFMIGSVLLQQNHSHMRQC